MDKIFVEWWDLWMKEVLSSLFPYKRWRKEEYNVAVGDICYLMFDSSSGAPTFRLCRVEKVYPDKAGLVRTVQVALRPRDARERSLPYVSKDLWRTDVSIQRLVMVIPKELQDNPKHSNAVVNLMDVSKGGAWPLLFSSKDGVEYHDFYHE